MTKRDFRATEGLLNDVMRKQAGSIEKAILEAIMNSVDADATEVRVTIDEDQIVIDDNGDGLTQDDIEMYFEQFGYKDDDIEDKEFGKFRMGRGQIFNFGRNIWHSRENLLVVDLDKDTTEVHQDLIGDINEDEHIGRPDSFYKFDSSGLSYIPLDASSFEEGCRIMVELYDSIDEPEKKATEVMELAEYIPFAHNVELTVNGTYVEGSLDQPVETARGWYSVDGSTFASGIRLYNKGAKVGNFENLPVQVTAISKQGLDVNFARNDVLDTCEIWKEMKNEVDNIVTDHLLGKQDLSGSDCRWLMSKASTNEEIRGRILNEPIIPDVNGKRWTLEQALDEKIVFASIRSETAKKANAETEFLYISDVIEKELRELVDSSAVYAFDDAWGQEMRWEMKEVSEDKLSKKRKQRLNILRAVARELACSDEVKAGMSSEENFWRNGEGVIVADKEFLNTSKDEFFFDGLVEFVRVMSHDGSTLEEFSPDFEYKNNLHRNFKEFGKIQRKAYNGSLEADPNN